MSREHLAERLAFGNMDDLNKYLRERSATGWRLITVLPVGDRPSLMGQDFQLMLFWRRELG